MSVSRQGIKVHTPHFIIIRKANDEGRDRLGVTVSARVGKAVARNRVKRLLRELFRRRRSKSRPHQDIVVIAKRGAAELSLERIAAELRGN
ncbi:MAG: ribonuclease P protein component [Deltaproteobacteria bacterium]|nr:ribonuclease P protein component [Deltaproteobacteria bacterium]